MVGTKLRSFLSFYLLWQMSCGVASQRSFWVNIGNSWTLGSWMCANGRCPGLGWGRQYVVMEGTEDTGSDGLWNPALVLTHCGAFGNLSHQYISVWDSSPKEMLKSTFSGVARIKGSIWHVGDSTFISLPSLVNKRVSNFRVTYEPPGRCRPCLTYKNLSQ